MPGIASVPNCQIDFSMLQANEEAPSTQEQLEFFQHIFQLKKTRRTGWLKRGIDNCESIADHMYRMAMIAMIMELPPETNRERCIMMALVHDLAEAIVGDITPECGISAEDKRSMESVMRNPQFN